MSDGFKTTLAVLGSVIFILFIAFCIGMCTQNFRNKVYDVLDVVPETEYISISEYNEILNTELTTEQNKLLKMTSDKATLQQKILDMESKGLADELTIANYQSQVDILTIQIENLNQRITTLQNDLLRVSNNVNNATITYKGITTAIECPMFDDNNNYLYYSWTGDSQQSTWHMGGSDILAQWNNNYSKVINNVYISLNNNNRHDVRICTNDMYLITIDGCSTQMNTNSNSFFFNKTANIEARIIFDGTEIDVNDIQSYIVDYQSYFVTLNIDYELDDNFMVTNCVLFFNITTNI